LPCGAIDFPTGKSLFHGKRICLHGSREANEAADDQFTVRKIALGEEPARRTIPADRSRGITSLHQERRYRRDDPPSPSMP
jgi:hypothetical protein